MRTALLTQGPTLGTKWSSLSSKAIMRVGKHTTPLNGGLRAPKNRNVPAPDKQSLISHAIFAINIVKRLNMFWRKVRAQ